jgi:hypothetical protein
VYVRSSPDAVRGWRRLPRLVLWWWIAFLLGVVRFTYQTVDVQTRVIHEYGPQFWNVVNGVAGAVAAVLAVQFVWRITRWRQDWRPYVRPQPTQLPSPR